MNMHIRLKVRRFVDDLVAEEMTEVDRVAAFLPPADPFKLDHDCLHPEGHDTVRSGRNIVCVHCSKVFGL